MSKERLEYLRGEIEAERISYGEISELQGLADQIEPGDVLLLQWAGVPEFPDDGDDELNGAMRIETLDDLRAAVARMDEAGFVTQDPGDNDKRICIEAVTTTRVLA